MKSRKAICFEAINKAVSDCNEARESVCAVIHILHRSYLKCIPSQVAQQTKRTTEDVMRAHENARKAQGNGVAAAEVGSGEKFSFSRLRQAITKKVCECAYAFELESWCMMYDLV